MVFLIFKNWEILFTYSLNCLLSKFSQNYSILLYISCFLNVISYFRDPYYLLVICVNWRLSCLVLSMVVTSQWNFLAVIEKSNNSFFACPPVIPVFELPYPFAWLLWPFGNNQTSNFLLSLVLMRDSKEVCERELSQDEQRWIIHEKIPAIIKQSMSLYKIT